jgi:hypothetical protein
MSPVKFSTMCVYASPFTFLECRSIHIFHIRGCYSGGLKYHVLSHPRTLGFLPSACSVAFLCSQQNTLGRNPYQSVTCLLHVSALLGHYQGGWSTFKVRCMTMQHCVLPSYKSVLWHRHTVHGMAVASVLFPLFHAGILSPAETVQCRLVGWLVERQFSHLTSDTYAR